MKTTLHRPSEDVEALSQGIFIHPTNTEDRFVAALGCLRGLSWLVSGHMQRHVAVDPSDLADLLNLIGRELQELYDDMGDVQ